MLSDIGLFIDSSWLEAKLRLHNAIIPAMRREFCPVCLTKWGRQLWTGSCVCSGDVSIEPYSPPGGHLEMHDWSPRKNASLEDKHAEVKEELHLPVETKVTKKLEAKITKYKDAMSKKQKA